MEVRHKNWTFLLLVSATRFGVKALWKGSEGQQPRWAGEIGLLKSSDVQLQWRGGRGASMLNLATAAVQREEIRPQEPGELLEVTLCALRAASVF